MPTMLTGVEKHVRFENTLDKPQHISHKMLPNGRIVVAPGEITYVPAVVWREKGKFRPGLLRCPLENEPQEEPQEVEVVEKVAEDVVVEVPEPENVVEEFIEESKPEPEPEKPTKKGKKRGKA